MRWLVVDKQNRSLVNVMMQIEPNDISLLFESSWEVCNKIGGIYTVLSTKAKTLVGKYGDKVIFIGPDVWSPENPSPSFIERKTLLKNAVKISLPYGLRIRVGRWNVPGSPLAVLVDFKPMYDHLNEIYGEMWNEYGVDSLHAYGDYAESCAFAVASAIVMKALTIHLKADPSKVIAHFDEWQTGMGLLYLQRIMPEASTVFTAHATCIGRSICGNGKPLYEYFKGYNGDQMAAELNMQSKHSLEKAAAHNADCFTTVSDVTSDECEQLLEIRPAMVTPNGFEPDMATSIARFASRRRSARTRLLKVAEALTGHKFISDDTFIIATSGRNEYRNKGLDLYIDAMQRLKDNLPQGAPDILSFIFVPAWVKEPDGNLLVNLHDGGELKVTPDNMTHRLNNEDSDPVACRLRAFGDNGRDSKVTLIYVPCYLDGHDGIVDIPYYDMLPALDLTAFPSYYEPWGYTPLESIASGIPTVTSDKAGFGSWILANFNNTLEGSGVKVIARGDSDYEESCRSLCDTAADFAMSSDAERKAASDAARKTAAHADWSLFICNYEEAYGIARKRAALRMNKLNDNKKK